MAEIEKSLRKALEEKVANLDQGAISTGTKDSPAETKEKVTVAMDKLTHEKQSTADT